VVLHDYALYKSTFTLLYFTKNCIKCTIKWRCSTITSTLKIGQVWRPVAPQPYVVQKSCWPRKLPGPWTTSGLNSISLQCIPWPVACSVWGTVPVWPTSDFRLISDLPHYDPDRVQKLISSYVSRYLSTVTISSKSIHAFLSNLANR